MKLFFRNLTKESFWILSLILVFGSGVQLVSFTPPDIQSRVCDFYLCDDTALTIRAYDNQLQGTKESLFSAVEMLTRLLVRDSASPQRWADLGDALSQANSVEKAQLCFAQALALGPHSASILISSGDFYLRHGNHRQGLLCLSRVLAITPERDQVVFSYFTAREVKVEDLLAYGLPQDRRPTHSYLRYLMSRNSLSEAPKVWEWMVHRRLIDDQIRIEYSKFLLSQGKFEEATSEWAPLAPNRALGEYLFNGGFEHEPTAAPFDPSLAIIDQVEALRVPESHSGKWALRIEFNGSSNVNYNQILKMAVLASGTYRFQAYVRTENLTTDQGVFFHISDMRPAGNTSIETQPSLGTTGWHKIETRFTTSAPTHLMEVHVVRRPSLRFDNKISGTVWIDDMSLTRVM